MSTLTNDVPIRVRSAGSPTGLAFAVLSAASFGMSGALARGLLENGWTPGAVVLARVAIAALVVLPFGLAALRGRWHTLRQQWRTVVAFGLVAVTATQFFYFSAISHMQVAPALLIELTAPAAVVGWLWVRRGERPGRLTLAGAGVAALGLVLVLDLLTGADLSVVGVMWSLAAMVGCASYFVMSADEGDGLPPIALAGTGLLVGALSLVVLGLVGVLQMRADTRPVELAGSTYAWWVPVLLLGVVTAGVSYVSGIAAIRRLGSRLASFVGLVEVVFGVVWAWALLGELPRTVQLLGGVLVMAGVVAVKLGERATAHPDAG